MSFWVYILQSKTTGRFYCGYSDNPDRRLQQHNDPEYTSTKTTKKHPGPWEIIWKHSVESRGAAMTLERKIKKRGINRYLHDIQSIESRNRQDP